MSNRNSVKNSMELGKLVKSENSIQNSIQNSTKIDQNSPSSAGSDIDDSALESAGTPNLSPSNSSAKENASKVIKVTRNSLNLSGSDEGIARSQILKIIEIYHFFIKLCKTRRDLRMFDTGLKKTVKVNARFLNVRCVLRK